ncbi:MAG: hypothetical protein HFJ11_05850 [Bacilli bacterium]|nr:hypothetical protein [Bacilli bacterium]
MLKEKGNIYEKDFFCNFNFNKVEKEKIDYKLANYIVNCLNGEKNE